MSGLVNSIGLASAGIVDNLVPLGSLHALEAGLNVPPSWRFDAKLLCHVMHYLDPRLASYMSQYGRPCAPITITNFHRHLPKYGREGKRAIRKVSGMLLKKALFAEYAEPPAERNEFAPFIAREAEPGGHLHYASMRTAGFYAPSALAQLVGDSARPDFAFNELVSVMYTLEAAARETGAVWASD